MKIKAKAKGNIVSVKMLLKHKMETGRRKDKQGNRIPAHHIKSVTAQANGEQVFYAELGPSISKNPFLAFAYKGVAGGKIHITWIDNKGESKSGEADIK